MAQHKSSSRRINVRQKTRIVTDLTDHTQSAKEHEKARQELERKVEERTAELQAEIAERKRLEQQLRAGEKRMNRMQEIALLGSWELDMATNRLSWSDQVYRIFGLRPQEFGATYEAFLDAVHPDDRAAVDEAYSGSLREGRYTYEIEHRVVRKSDGKIRFVHEKCEHLRDSSGRIVQSIGMVQDITERKRMEEEVLKAYDALEQRVEERTEELRSAYEALRDSRERLDMIANSIPAIIAYIDRDERYRFANNAYKRWYGISPEEMIGKQVREVTGAKTYEKISPRIREVLSGRKVSFDLVLPLPDGALHNHHVEYVPDTGKDGTVWGYYLLVYDTTERRQAEEERLRLAAAIESAAEGVSISLVDRTIVYVNSALCRMTGYQREDLIGKKTALLQKGPDAHVGEDLVTTVDAGKVWSGRLTRERKDGSLYHVDLDVSPVIDAEGRFVGRTGIHRDITDRVALEERLRQAHKMEAIGTLAGGVAHDFNNMLAVIIGNAELALDDFDDRPAPRQNIEQIINASKRATDLVKQILAFTRKTEQKRGILSLTPLIKETCKLLRSSLPTTIEITLDIQTASDTIIGDPSEMQQVLMNLATNSAYSMRDRGGTLLICLSDVTLALREKMPETDMQPGRYVKLCVKDTGTGITEDVQRRMFEPFFTTKETGQGTGMGLAVVYGIVKRHGGAISVESKAGEGSSLTIFLPWSEERAKENKEKDIVVPGGEEKILVVDDESTVVEMTSKVLGRLGYAVTTEVNAARALTIFLNDPHRFDLVITDQTMPDHTGIDLAQKMLEVRKDLPIILMTGYSETVSPEQAKSVGISAFVMKPLVKRQLAETIRKVLDKESGNRQVPFR